MYESLFSVVGFLKYLFLKRALVMNAFDRVLFIKGALLPLITFFFFGAWWSKISLKMVLKDDRPLKIINAYENRSAAVIKMNSFEDTYLYVIRFIDESISKYLTESEEAINFYYTVENQNLGIKISFAIIYIVIVALLLFLAIKKTS